MFRFTNYQKRLYADKLVDFAHLLIGGLVIGGMVSNNKIEIILLPIGIVSSILLYYGSYLLSRNAR